MYCPVSDFAPHFILLNYTESFQVSGLSWLTDQRDSPTQMSVMEMMTADGIPGTLGETNQEEIGGWGEEETELEAGGAQT